MGWCCEVQSGFTFKGNGMFRPDAVAAPSNHAKNTRLTLVDTTSNEPAAADLPRALNR